MGGKGTCNGIGTIMGLGGGPFGSFTGDGVFVPISFEIVDRVLATAWVSSLEIVRIVAESWDACGNTTNGPMSSVPGGGTLTVRPAILMRVVE